MRLSTLPLPMRAGLLALAFVTISAPGRSADSDTVRLESRVSRLEDRIAYFDDLLRDVRNRGTVERQFADVDRRMRMMASEIAALRSQVNALEKKLAEPSGDREPSAAPAPEPAKPDGKK